MEPEDLLKAVVNVLTKLNLRYAVVGSMASMYYGEARFTNDVDILVELPSSRVPEFVESFPEDQFYLSEDGIRSAIKHRQQFNILHPASGLKCDIILPKGDELNDLELAEAKLEEPFEGVFARYSPPEVVILKKLQSFEEGGSEKHLRDIASMLKINQTGIDRDLVSR